MHGCGRRESGVAEPERAEHRALEMNIQRRARESLDDEAERDEAEIAVQGPLTGRVGGGELGDGGNAWMSLGYSNDDPLFARDLGPALSSCSSRESSRSNRAAPGWPP